MQANFNEEQNYENEWMNYGKSSKDVMLLPNQEYICNNTKNIKKKKVIDPEMRKTGHWTSDEHKKYMDFLMDHKD